jgi:hypothetical protein
VEHLLGREEELAVLCGLVDGIAAGGGAMTVQGEPGIGKSSLLRAVADYGKAAGLRILRAEGVAAEAQLPFAGLHQLLRPVRDGAVRLPGPQRQALAAAFGWSPTTRSGSTPRPATS